jgi:hypothetical protein
MLRDRAWFPSEKCGRLKRAAADIFELRNTGETGRLTHYKSEEWHKKGRLELRDFTDISYLLVNN